MKRVGRIGVGIMGKSMVRNLMKAGFELHTYIYTKARVEDVIHEGAILHETIRDCVEGCEAAITMVGFPRDVEKVCFAESNVLNNAGAGAYLIDMTATSPASTKRLSKAGTVRGYHIIDTPVTGDDRGVRSGALFTMVGGEQKDYEACLPLFQAMGENIRYHGKAGCSQYAELVNQIIIVGTFPSICEMLAHVEVQRFDLQTMFDSASTGSTAGRQPSSLAPRITDDGYTPEFFLKHFVKDIEPVLKEADAAGLDPAILRQTLSSSKELEDVGYDDLGTWALIERYG